MDKIVLRSRHYGRKMEIEQFLKDHPDAVVISSADIPKDTRGRNIEYIDPFAIRDMLCGIQDNSYDIFKDLGITPPSVKPQILRTDNPRNDFWQQWYKDNQ